MFLFLSLALLALSAGAAYPEESASPAGSEDPRRRWERLPEERRAELRRIYERLGELDPAERRLLMERLRSMGPAERREAIRRAREIAERSARAAPPRKTRKDALRDRIEKLPPAERKKLLGASPSEIRAYLAERRKASISKLPPELRERAESLPPREQAELIRRFRAERLIRETFRGPEEVKALRSLFPREAAEALGMGRPPRPGTKDVERPAFISEETWARWKSLPPADRQRILRHLAQERRAHPEHRRKAGP